MGGGGIGGALEMRVSSDADEGCLDARGIRWHKRGLCIWLVFPLLDINKGCLARVGLMTEMMMMKRKGMLYERG